MFWVAWEGGRAVGAADAGVLVQQPEPFGYAWVLPDERRHGIGSRLYETISAYAASRGKDALEAWVEDASRTARRSSATAASIEIGREIRVSLDLTKIEPPRSAPPESPSRPGPTGRSSIRGIYEVAVEASADIPGDEDREVEPFEDWVAHEMEAGPGDRKDATFVALAGEEVVGYSKFSLSDAQPKVAHHDLTGVRRAWRKQGIARALKQTQIAWAKHQGFERLETTNEERNAPIRKLNAEFGYEPSGARILFRGPLS